MGAKAVDKVPSIIARIMKINLLLAVICAAAMLLFPRSMQPVYTVDTGLISDAIPSLWVIAAALLVASLSNVYFSGISGTGNTRQALVIELSVQLLVSVYIFLTAWWFKWNVAACFTYELVCHTLLLLGSHLYFRHFNWRKTRI